MKNKVFLSVFLLLFVGFAKGAANHLETNAANLYSLLSQLATAEQEDEKAPLIASLTPNVQKTVRLLDVAKNQCHKKIFDQKLDEATKFLYYMLPVKGREFNQQDVQQFQLCSHDLASDLAAKLNKVQSAFDACDRHDEDFFVQSELSHSFE